MTIALPHAIYQIAKGVDQLSLESKWIPEISLPSVESIPNEIVMDGFDVGDHLESTVHVAGVAEVLEAARLSD